MYVVIVKDDSGHTLDVWMSKANPSQERLTKLIDEYVKKYPDCDEDTFSTRVEPITGQLN